MQTDTSGKRASVLLIALMSAGYVLQGLALAAPAILLAIYFRDDLATFIAFLLRTLGL
ncbi:MAG: hypothetical protein J0J10_01010 [Bosea sp.]|uniref:hypothetical protein n=1 Tax=Bosea sp. (in: a-proteobacteria) TaxID=1871050 RepID=UPI001AC1CF00|nr:hypothetical protein [Bosea sp. (in: a-proteobacteria)]MBN9467326.1 hypothetical protein [Bosea sp. (in: a-proteobacteria)]